MMPQKTPARMNLFFIAGKLALRTERMNPKRKKHHKTDDGCDGVLLRLRALS